MWFKALTAEIDYFGGKKHYSIFQHPSLTHRHLRMSQTVYVARGQQKLVAFPYRNHPMIRFLWYVSLLFL
jgi:hypothetical protein